MTKPILPCAPFKSRRGSRPAPTIGAYVLRNANHCARRVALL